MRANRSSIFLTVAGIVLLAIAFTLASVAANDSIHQPRNHPQTPPLASSPAQANKTYTLYSGLWRTDGSFVSTIRIKNVLVVAPMDVTPVVFMADGTPYMLTSVHVAVSGVTTVNINDALASAPSSIAGHVTQFGSAALIYTYSSQGHLTASMAVIDAARSLSYTYPFVEPMNMPGHDSKQVLEGLWWKRDNGVTGFVTLSNTTDQQQSALLTPVRPGGSESPRQVTLAPHSTDMLKLEDLTSQASDPANRAGGIRVEYEGSQGTILVTGGLENDSEGYSANIPFWGHDMSSTSPTSITYAIVGLMLGKPDPMMMPGFPKETTFSAYMSLLNTTERPLDIALQLNYMPGTGMPGGAPVTRNLPAQHLAPFEAKQVELQGALNAAGLKNFNGSINLSTSFTGRGGDLILATGSVDQTGTYVFEVGAQGIGPSQSKFANYWGVANGNDTMFTLWNPTASAQDILATFYYGDGSGKYALPVHLDPQASTTIDMAMLIAEHQPDTSGNIISPSVREGSASFASAKGLNTFMTVVISGGIYNVSTATCGLNCIYCCGDSNPSIVPNPIFCPIGESMYCDAQVTNCYGNVVSWQASWSSSNPSVMTVDGSGKVTGISVGSAGITANFAPISPTTGNICVESGAPPPSCPTGYTPVASAPANVGTLGCTPSSVTRGSNVTCSVSGAPTGATFSNWKFTDSSNNIVAGSGSTNSWSGTMVTSGTVSVSVAVGGNSTPLSASVTVNNRNWHTGPATAGEVANGTLITLPVPPQNTGDDAGLGYFKWHYVLNSGPQYSTINDNGPNQGYTYWPSNQIFSTWNFQYEINPDLENTGSTFYQSQCGNYNATTNPNGFVSGSNLLAQTNRHEWNSSTVSHYAFYSISLNSSSNNPGDFLEQQIAPPAANLNNFATNSNSGITSRLSTVTSDSQLEPYPVNDDAAGNFLGNINYAPYTSCQ